MSEDSLKDTKEKPLPAAAQAAQAEGKGKGKDGGEEDEIDYDEVWGDYIEYMTHQRDQGWKT